MSTCTLTSARNAVRYASSASLRSRFHPREESGFFCFAVTFANTSGARTGACSASASVLPAFVVAGNVAAGGAAVTAAAAGAAGVVPGFPFPPAGAVAGAAAAAPFLPAAADGPDAFLLLFSSPGVPTGGVGFLALAGSCAGGRGAG
ncbi:hypothetical protein BDZ88DRAFT_422279 [Geranomyces variabilis]|nr:hypothetical protein BDZ88DRAFT_422279 [Geranomyces variabilis]